MLKGTGGEAWSWKNIPSALFYPSKQITDQPRFQGWETQSASSLEKLQNHIAMSVQGVENQGHFFFLYSIYYMWLGYENRGIGNQVFSLLQSICGAARQASCRLDSDPTKPVKPVLQPSFMLYSFGAQQTFNPAGQINVWKPE